jgi:hypothetical protein
LGLGGLSIFFIGNILQIADPGEVMHQRYIILKGLIPCFVFTAGMLAATFADAVLTVKTDPDGIEVWLGDKFLGQSPILGKKIKAGRYMLKLVDPVQHSSTTEDLFIQDNDTSVIERTISSKFGSLRVSSEPEGADVYIAMELGRTPLTNDFMNPGKYRIEIRPFSPRYHTKTSEVIIDKGETATLSETLEKDKLFFKKTVLSFALFSGSVGGFIWGLVEQGHYRMYNDRMPVIQSKVDDAAFKRTLGIILGSSCAVGLEIITFF